MFPTPKRPRDVIIAIDVVIPRALVPHRTTGRKIDQIDFSSLHSPIFPPYRMGFFFSSLKQAFPCQRHSLPRNRKQLADEGKETTGCAGEKKILLSLYEIGCRWSQPGIEASGGTEVVCSLYAAYSHIGEAGMALGGHQSIHSVRLEYMTNSVVQGFWPSSSIPPSTAGAITKR